MSGTRSIACSLFAAALLATAAGRPVAASPTAPAATTPAPPPIILISIDTLRSDRLPGVKTPAIDRLAADGIVFERAYSHSPLTMPSHATLLSGLLPPAHGVRDNIGYRFAAAAVPYLPRLLRQAGYATGAAVSAHVLRAAGGFGDGFDFYDDDIPRRRRAGVGGLQRPGGETLERARPWLRAHADGPFFLFFHLFEPHTPYEPPEPFASRYGSPYDGEVAAADRVVGDLLAELTDLGVYRRAVVLLLSDHGEGLGDHGEDEHGVLLYRESLQVPLILKLPGERSAGTRSPRPVQLADVAPTLLALAGLGVPAELPGRSLLELLKAAAAPRPIYAETFFPRLHFGWSDLASIILGRHHYIEGPSPELYDLVADPAEKRDLLAREPGLAAELRAALAAYDRKLEPPAAVSAEERRALAALGYVGEVGGSEPAGPLPDPKSRLGTVRDLKEGLRAYSAGRLEEAARHLRRAVAENPRSLDAWEYLGRAATELGQRRQALAAFGRALDLAAGRAGHLAVAAALLLIEAGEPAKALELLGREIPRTPDDLPLRLLEARTLALAGRSDEALAGARELARRVPDNADAVYLRGALLMGRGALEEGEADLRRALELAPDHPAAMNDLAVLLERRGEVAEARRLYRRLLELRPGDRGAAQSLRRLDAAVAGGGEDG